MCQAPNTIDERQLKETHIKVVMPPRTPQAHVTKPFSVGGFSDPVFINPQPRSGTKVPGAQAPD